MRVGIVTPAHDVAAYIATAIDSVIAQSHTDWAFVVVDDGSRDATAAIASTYADPRLRLLRQANAGVSAARNAGLAALPPVDAILFLDADDWLAPDALARLIAALRPGAVASCGAYALVDEAARPGDAPRTVRRRPCGGGGDMLARLLLRNRFVNGGHVLLRADAVARAGPFRTDLRYGEDWEFMTRIALLGPVAAAPGPPVLYARQRHGGATLGMATDPAAHAGCIDAIYANPKIVALIGARLPALRRAAEAERDWIIGRELIRHGHRDAGLAALGRATRARPHPRRLALYAAAHALPLLPPRLHGPFRAYPARGYVITERADSVL